MQSDAVARRIASDYDSALRNGATGTPTFFINGRRYRGPARVEPMLAAIRTQLAKTPAANDNAR
jgi:protein-disulfide isomerase